MLDVTMISRADLEDVIREAARRGAEEAIRNMPKDRPALREAGTVRLNSGGAG